MAAIKPEKAHAKSYISINDKDSHSSLHKEQSFQKAINQPHLREKNAL